MTFNNNSQPGWGPPQNWGQPVQQQPAQQPYTPPLVPPQSPYVPPVQESPYVPPVSQTPHVSPVDVQSPYNPRPAAPKKQTWLLILIVAVSVVVIAGSIIFKVNQATPPPTPPLPLPVPTTTTAPKPSTTSAVPSPSATTAPLPTAPPTASTPIGEISAFFRDPVKVSDPGDYQTEDDTKATLTIYGTALVLWLTGQQTDFSTLTDPMVGQWTSTSGSFNFTGSEFYWYQEAGNTADNYTHGVYRTYPGCTIDTGFTLEVDGIQCYSVFFHYTDEMTNQVQSYDTYYGLFVVAASPALPNMLAAADKRSEEDVVLSRS